jgi:hypothetical protein
MDVPDESGLASSLDPSAPDATVSEIRISAIPGRRRLFAIAVLAGLLGHPLLMLRPWPVLTLAVLAGVDRIHRSERRQRPHDAHEIYRTPAVVHVRRRLATRRLGRDRVAG